jgi:hypothetical protein
MILHGLIGYYFILKSIPGGDRRHGPIELYDHSNDLRISLLSHVIQGIECNLICKV